MDGSRPAVGRVARTPTPSSASTHRGTRTTPARTTIPMTLISDDSDPLAITYAYDSIWVTLRNTRDRRAASTRMPRTPEDPHIKERYDLGEPTGTAGSGRRLTCGWSTTPATRALAASTASTPMAPVPDAARCRRGRSQRPGGRRRRPGVGHPRQQLRAGVRPDSAPQGDPIPVGDGPDELAVLHRPCLDRRPPQRRPQHCIDPDSRTVVDTLDLGGNPSGLRAEGNLLGSSTPPKPGVTDG